MKSNSLNTAFLLLLIFFQLSCIGKNSSKTSRKPASEETITAVKDSSEPVIYNGKRRLIFPQFNWKLFKSDPLPPSFHVVDNTCHRYIKADGTYGEQGKLLIKELIGEGRSTNRWELFMDKEIPGIEAICRNYNQLEPLIRIKFWVWFMASIAYAESSCAHPRKMINPSDPDGISIGEFMMPERWRSCKFNEKSQHIVCTGRYNRGPGCNGLKENKVSLPGFDSYMYDSKNNIPCAVEVFGATMYGCYKNNQRICQGISRPWSTKGMFFKELITDKVEGKILQRAKEFPPCTDDDLGLSV